MIQGGGWSEGGGRRWRPVGVGGVFVGAVVTFLCGGATAEESRRRTET